MFPPHRTSSLGQLLEIRDPWEAPRKYTADLYTGGDIPLSPRIHADVDHIGAMDDKFVEEGDEVDISQHSGKDKAPVLHVTSRKRGFPRLILEVSHFLTSLDNPIL